MATVMERKELGQILLEKGYITVDQLDEALLEQEKGKEYLGEILVAKGFVTTGQIVECLTEQQKADFIDLAKLGGLKEEVVKIIPENIARRYGVLAVAQEGEKLVVAMKDPNDIVAIDTIMRVTGWRVKVVQATPEQIERYLDRYYQESVDLSKTTSALATMEGAEEKVDVNQLLAAAEDAPIVKFVNSLFLEAVEKRATDIHLEPQESQIAVRFRIDGSLRQFPYVAKGAYAGIVTRLKILSNLDIGERRLPQDGRTKIRIGNWDIDIRISTLPTIYGEKVVLRLLDRRALVKTLNNLGLEPAERKVYEESLEQPHGMILVVGPTGSGKTTTLYSGLSFINTLDRNIVTIEDPVEYELTGINQVQIKPKIGLTFAEVLKRMMRQDPDVIMVGEIRDLETAQIAIQSALTGHLVISTLHTSDAISTLARLNYMGVPSYLIAESIQLLIAQRLVRCLCKTCQQEDEEGLEVLKKMDVAPGDGVKVYKGRGCSKCDFTGYLGRTAIFEVVKVDKDLKKSILAGADEEEIREWCQKKGVSSLRTAALNKVLEGVTTVEEFLGKTMA